MPLKTVCCTTKDVDKVLQLELFTTRDIKKKYIPSIAMCSYYQVLYIPHATYDIQD
jgi:hypothetical protein